MKNFINKLALSAGREILRNAGKLKKDDVQYKGSTKNTVTRIDKEAEKFIINKIRKKYPQHTIVSEESDIQKGNTFSWFIDPIDGTNNFLHNFPLYAVSIAFADSGILLNGAVYVPFFNELFYAARNKGAYLNNKKITVSKTENLDKSLIATGFAGLRDNLKKEEENKIINNFVNVLNHIQGIRRLGSAAIDLCYVAIGRCDGFWEHNLNSWDLAAGSLIVREAGGRVTDLNGNNKILNSNNIIATNGIIHKQLLQNLTI